MAIKFKSNLLHHSMPKSNTSSLAEIRSAYITSLPFKHEKKIANVEDFSLLFHKGVAIKKKNKDTIEHYIQVSQFEYNKLIVIHKGNKKRLSCQTENFGNYSLSHQKEILKNGNKPMIKKNLFLPTLSTSMLKINSQKNILKTPLAQYYNTKENIEKYKDYNSNKNKMKKGIIRRSPGNGICVKIGEYKKKSPRKIESLVDILNNKDYMSSIIHHRRPIFHSDYSMNPIQTHDKSKHDNSNDELDKSIRNKRKI